MVPEKASAGVMVSESASKRALVSERGSAVVALDLLGE